MELQVVIIGAVVFVVSAIIIYLISAFTMKEKTFEEVIAEQRREQEELQQKSKQEKKAEKETRRRFKPKGKLKGDQSPKASTSSEPEKEHKMVNIELEPEIIEPVEAEVPLKMSKKKDKPTKTILHNRDEKTPVVPQEFVEEFVHVGPAPKDDLELKHSHEAKKDKQKKDKAKKKEVEQPVVEEMMVVTESRVQTVAPPMSDSAVRFKGEQTITEKYT
jgi:hypothetical protein